MSHESFDQQFPEREAQFTQLTPGSTRIVICSDERLLNAASAALLQETYGVDPNAQTNRTFGGTHGYAYVGGLAAAAQGGEAAVQEFAGNFNGLAAETRTMLDQSSEGKIIAIDHSDDQNDHEATLDMDTDGGLGCAFNKLFGGVAGIAATNTEVQDEAREEYVDSVDTDPAMFDQALSGAKTFFGVICNGDTAFGLGRADMLETADKTADGQPVLAILTGSHAPVDQALEVANYVPNSTARRDGVMFETDMADVALGIVRAYQQKGVELNAKTVLAGLILSRAAVRFALSGMQARTMQHAVRGTAQAAIEYVEAHRAA